MAPAPLVPGLSGLVLSPRSGAVSLIWHKAGRHSAGSGRVLLSHGIGRHQPGLDLVLGLAPCAVAALAPHNCTRSCPGAASASGFLASWLRWCPLGACAPRVGRQRGAPAPALAFRTRQPLFLSLRLSSSALKLPNPEKPTFSFAPSSAPRLPASPLTNGSTAPSSHPRPACGGEHGPGHSHPASLKKKHRKQHPEAGGSPCALAVNGKDEACSPPKKRRNVAQEGSLSPAGRGAAAAEGGGGREEQQSRPKQQTSAPSCFPGAEPAPPLKKKKKKRRLQEMEERCLGTLPSGR